MNDIDQLIDDLNSGILLLKSEHTEVAAYALRVKNEGEASEDSDFSILTPTQCVEFTYHPIPPLIIDCIAEMPTNPAPFHLDFTRCFPGDTFWPIRDLIDISGLTIHHTMSHSPLATARYIVNTKGYPTTQYHYWVSASDNCPIYHLVDDHVMLWHDHTGTYQQNLSIGMAGHLGRTRPPAEQLWKTILLVIHLLDKYNLTIDSVDGHHERALPSGINTECPGWLADTPNTINSGVWKRDFCIALRLAIDGGTWSGY